VSQHLNTPNTKLSVKATQTATEAVSIIRKMLAKCSMRKTLMCCSQMSLLCGWARNSIKGTIITKPDCKQVAYTRKLGKMSKTQQGPCARRTELNVTGKTKVIFMFTSFSNTAFINSLAHVTLNFDQLCTSQLCAQVRTRYCTLSTCHVIEGRTLRARKLMKFEAGV